MLRVAPSGCRGGLRQRGGGGSEQPPRDPVCSHPLLPGRDRPFPTSARTFGRDFFGLRKKERAGECGEGWTAARLGGGKWTLLGFPRSLPPPPPKGSEEEEEVGVQECCCACRGAGARLRGRRGPASSQISPPAFGERERLKIASVLENMTAPPPPSFPHLPKLPFGVRGHNRSRGTRHCCVPHPLGAYKGTMGVPSCLLFWGAGGVTPLPGGGGWGAWQESGDRARLFPREQPEQGAGPLPTTVSPGLSPSAQPRCWDDKLPPHGSSARWVSLRVSGCHCGYQGVGVLLRVSGYWGDGVSGYQGVTVGDGVSLQVTGCQV